MQVSGKYKYKYIQIQTQKYLLQYFQVLIEFKPRTKDESKSRSSKTHPTMMMVMGMIMMVRSEGDIIFNRLRAGAGKEKRKTFTGGFRDCALRMEKCAVLAFQNSSPSFSEIASTRFSQSEQGKSEHQKKIASRYRWSAVYFKHILSSFSEWFPCDSISLGRGSNLIFHDNQCSLLLCFVLVRIGSKVRPSCFSQSWGICNDTFQWVQCFKIKQE